MSKNHRRRVPRAAALAALALLAAGAQQAAAAGTITVTAGGTRTATDSDGGYAAPLGGVAFERAPWVANPAAAAWTPLCTTDATGACTSGTVPNGRYLVREAAGAPAGWRTLPTLAWGGASDAGSPVRPYVGDVTVANNAPVARPSTAWSPTAPSGSSGRFVAALGNPALPQRCGIDVLLLLDRSGSVTDDAATYRAAAQQFVDTLAGTPTRVKIFSFAASATANQNTFLDLSNPADVAAAKSTIASIYATTAGATNWDAGLRLASTAGVDLVTLITDGNPTTRDAIGGGGPGSTVELLDLTAGIASANSVKTLGKGPAGATIRAIGVGDGVTAANLAAISGPVADTDYSTSGVAGLGAQLQSFANRLCGARIHVRKLTDTPDPAAPKAGWTITASAGAGASVSPASFVTSGTLNDQVNIDRVPAAGVRVSLAETQQPGYVLVAAGCQQGGWADPAGGGATTLTLPTVRRGEDWYCTYRNARNIGTIEVRKALAPAGDPGRFDLDIDGGSPEAVGVGNGGSTGAVTVAGGVPHTISEAPHAGTAGAYATTYVCTSGGAPVASGEGPTIPQLTISAGQAVVCTFTNTRVAVAPPVTAADVPRGSARLIGTAGCVPRGGASISVLGTHIRTVTFSYDGKARKRLLRPNRGVRWTLTIPAGRLRYGVHRVLATVTFTAASRTPSRTLSRVIVRCRPVRPHFTG